MNYIKEINAFMDWLETNPLEATTQTLWFHIMAIANKSGWPEWFTIANLTLMAKVGVSENTLIKHRNILMQKGRIEYKNQGKQKAGKYKIVSFTSKFEVRREVNNNVTSKNEVSRGVKEDVTSNIEVSREVNPEVKCEVNPSALYKLNKTKLNDINNSTTPEPVTSKNEVSHEDIIDKELSKLGQLYQKSGFDVNGLTSDWLMDLKQRYGFEWVKNAILEAESQGVRSKAYVQKILGNWKTWGGMKLSSDLSDSSKPNFSKRKKTFTNKQTRFHNFEQRTDDYTEDDLEAIAERKRQEYIKSLKKAEDFSST